MIQAAFYTDKSSGSISLKLSGHAGAANKGQDIICSAASMLAYTVAQTAQYMYAQEASHRYRRRQCHHRGEA